MVQKTLETINFDNGTSNMPQTPTTQHDKNETQMHQIAFGICVCIDLHEITRNWQAFTLNSENESISAKFSISNYVRILQQPLFELFAQKQ